MIKIRRREYSRQDRRWDAFRSFPTDTVHDHRNVIGRKEEQLPGDLRPDAHMGSAVDDDFEIRRVVLNVGDD